MMRKRFLHSFILPALVLAAGAAAVGCSVKEDREPCPAVLHVSYAGRPEVAPVVGLMAWDGVTERFRTAVDFARHTPYWDKMVRKGVLDLAAWNAGTQVSANGRHVLIPVGSQCDSLYAFHTIVDATGEDAYAEVSLLKQFATVTVVFGSLSGGLDGSVLVVGGNTCGFDLADLSPVPGTFRFEPRPEAGASSVSFRVPRQSDDSLTLSGIVGGVEISPIPLGRYITLMGYDWTEPELRDITVRIDLVIGNIRIDVEEWEDGAWFDLVQL